MKRFGVWFNVEYLKRVKKDVFVKNQKQTGLKEAQLIEVWEEINPPEKPSKVSKVETPEK